jgi:hypothetical protein
LKIALMDAGAGSETAEFICSEFRTYYTAGLTPYPEDRVFSTLRIDPGDIEDAVQEYWKLREWELPSLTEPKLVPSDPTLVELALWIESGGQHSRTEE